MKHYKNINYNVIKEFKTPTLEQVQHALFHVDKSEVEALYNDFKGELFVFTDIHGKDVVMVHNRSNYATELWSGTHKITIIGYRIYHPAVSSVVLNNTHLDKYTKNDFKEVINEASKRFKLVEKYINQYEKDYQKFKANALKDGFVISANGKAYLLKPHSTIIRTFKGYATNRSGYESSVVENVSINIDVFTTPKIYKFLQKGEPKDVNDIISLIDNHKIIRTYLKNLVSLINWFDNGVYLGNARVITKNGQMYLNDVKLSIEEIVELLSKYQISQLIDIVLPEFIEKQKLNKEIEVSLYNN